MGNFRVTISAIGGHGQDRGRGNGETVDFEKESRESPEAIIKRAVEELKANGCSVSEATVHHWPGSSTEVVDNLLTGKRAGNF